MASLPGKRLVVPCQPTTDSILAAERIPTFPIDGGVYAI